MCPQPVATPSHHATLSLGGIRTPCGNRLPSVETWGHVEKVAMVLSHFSRADPFVKTAMAHEGVLNALMKVRYHSENDTPFDRYQGTGRSAALNQAVCEPS